MPTAEETITQFLAAVKAGDIAGSLGHFSNDSGAPPNNIPCVGISYHATNIGPAFRGKTQISVLLTELFRCFKPLELKRLGAPDLQYPANTGTPSEIGIQAELFGTHVAKWFDGSLTLKSRPLSNIPPNTATPRNLTDSDGHGVPTFALFTFDGNNQIQRLALYLDRFKFVERLGEEDLSFRQVEFGTSEKRSRVMIQID